MRDAEAHRTEHPEVEACVRGLIDQAAADRLPELFSDLAARAVYHLPNRHGVSVVLFRSHDLSEEQVIRLLKYRLAQYLSTGFVDPEMVYETQMEHEPLANVRPNDIHVVAGCPETGEILCYSAFRTLPETPTGATLRGRDRPLFPAEKNHGWGVFNRLKLLPDLPIHRIYEMGRFVKNQRRHQLDELSARATVEGGAAVVRALLGPLRAEVDAIIGDLEENVVKQNLDFFQIPSVIIHGTVPYEAEQDYLFARYQNTVVYPFAFLTADLSAARERLEAVEQAIALPGKRGLAALFVLKRDIRIAPSSLEPEGGLSPLATTRLPQRGVAMQTRREMLEVAERLRRLDLFQNLSVAEAAVLGTLVERVEVEAGEVIIRQGEEGDALFLIEAGEAEARVRTTTGETVPVATRGPGDYFGEIALLTGGARTADVVALTPLKLVRLTKDAYTRYLAEVAEVEQHVARTAARRTTETLRKLTSGDA
jgi:cyclic nucleotide-binding protein